MPTGTSMSKALSYILQDAKLENFDLSVKVCYLHLQGILTSLVNSLGTSHLENLKAALPSRYSSFKKVALIHQQV